MRRRSVIKAGFCLPVIGGCASYSDISSRRALLGLPPLSEAELIQMKRFDHVGGFRLDVDAFGKKVGVNLFDHNGYLLQAKSVYTPTSGSSKSVSKSRIGCTVPLTVRVRWRDKPLPMSQENRDRVNDFESRNRTTSPFFGGQILGDYTVPVAERIPQDLLDELPSYRKFNMGLNIKFRIHDEGLLVGWHIGGFLERVHAGGDFEDAHVVLVYQGKGKLAAKQFKNGWYIHPITKEKIITDF